MSLWRLFTSAHTNRLIANLKLKTFRFSVLQRPFHTSLPRRALPPVVYVLLKPLSRALALLLGRRYRLWWRRLPSDKRIEYIGLVRSYKSIALVLATAVLGFVLLLIALHIQECPVTGRKRFVALTPDQAVKIGHKEHNTLMETYSDSLLGSNHPLYRRVSRVGTRVLRANVDIQGVKGKTWSVNVVNKADRNAFVLPSGDIFVFRGMLDLCTNDDQLGVIISHEIAHTVLNHVAEKLSYLSVLNLLLMLPLAMLWLLFPNDGLALVADWFVRKFVDLVVELPFSRDLETEADHVGLFLAARACFDIREAPNFWRKMHLLQKDIDPPQLLSTHPANESREKTLMLELPKAIALRMQCGCPPLRGLDPNQVQDQRLLLAQQKVAQRLKDL